MEKEQRDTSGLAFTLRANLGKRSMGRVLLIVNGCTSLQSRSKLSWHWEKVIDPMQALITLMQKTIIHNPQYHSADHCCPQQIKANLAFHEKAAVPAYLTI